MPKTFSTKNKIIVAALVSFVGFFLSGAAGDETPIPKVRKFYAAPADYPEQLKRARENFAKKYGYQLADLDRGWKKEEIEKLDRAFSKLPPGFLFLSGLDNLYRVSEIMGRDLGPSSEDVPAGVFPSFMPVYRAEGGLYNVVLNDEDPRVEFYNALFYEDESDFENIVHHEMGHAFDLVAGFLSFSKDWLAISNFRILHLPPLDAVEGGDFLYTLVNDPNVDVYAPVSSRHISTYSRTSPQEDFANSVAAYIHYPFFQWTHPRRYAYLKEKVFKGKEYFAENSATKSWEELAEKLFKAALNSTHWDEAIKVAREAGRSHNPGLQIGLTAILKSASLEGLGQSDALQLGVISCHLYAPEALEFRQNLIRKRGVESEALLKDEQCAKMGRDGFEKILAPRPLESLFFYRENGKEFLQFLDPAAPAAWARDFETIYSWKMSYEGDDTGTFALGEISARRGNGAVKIDLEKTANQPYDLEPGRPVILELLAERVNRRNFKRIKSVSQGIRFAAPHWFRYFPDKESVPRIVYPIRKAYKGK